MAINMKKFTLTLVILGWTYVMVNGQTPNFDLFTSATPGFAYTNAYDADIKAAFKNGEELAFKPIWVYSQLPLAKALFIADDIKDWYDDVPNTQIMVKYMPPINNQGGYPYCYTYAYSTILKQFKAKAVNFAATNCLPTSLDVSDLALTRIMHTIDDGGFYLNYEKPIQVDNNGAFQNMLKRNDKYIAESSKPYENIGIGYTSNLAENRMDDLSYYMHKAQEKYSQINAGTDEIYDVTNTIAARLNWSPNQIDVKKALIEKDFDKFTSHLLFDNAVELENNFTTQNVKIKYAPTSISLNNFSIQPLWFIKSKIKEALNNDIPVFISIMYKGSNDYSHCVVISGYKKVQKDNIIKECYKIQNSWGENWQAQKADGWIDAEIMLRYLRMSYNTDFKIYGIIPQAVVWFGDENDFMIKHKDDIIYR